MTDTAVTKLTQYKQTQKQHCKIQMNC